MIDFNVAFDRLMGHEGGYVNHPRDPGGETNWGISRRSYPHLDIAKLTREDAKQIYWRDFWFPISGVHDAVKFQAFDAAINHGIGNATRMLQRAVGVADDGHWGPVSASAAAKIELNDQLLRFLAERLDFMRKLITFKEFGVGWAGRIVSNMRYAAEDN